MDVRRYIAMIAVGVAATAPPAAAKSKKDVPDRRGGTVHHAWPAKGAKGKPKNPLAQWLAKQVGPIAVKKGSSKRRASRAGTGVTLIQTAAGGALSLVRSYEIPSGDPSLSRLANLSWTYDAAISAIAFQENGYTTQAQQILDQLAALQRTDGSIDFAFDTSTGSSVTSFRTGTVAWLGLAAIDYRALHCSTRYDAVAYAAAKWLLARQSTTSTTANYGLLTGGTGVTWTSTQNNFVARAFFDAFANVIQGKAANTGYSTCSGGISGVASSTALAFATSLRNAVTLIDSGINRALYTKTSSTSASFRQGVGDDVHPLDAQALGILWLIGQGRRADAALVSAYADSAMAISNRSVVKSAATATYNNTYAAAGPFSGYRPYAEAGSPDVLWTEGTFEQRFARAALYQSTTALDLSLYSWQMITPSSGPLQADKTVSNSSFNEYHVWPAGAAAAWELINLTDFSLLS